MALSDIGLGPTCLNKGSYTNIAQFSKIAPYLVNPFVLIGLCLFLVYGLYEALLKAKVLKPVKPEDSSGIIRILLRYSFWLALITVVLGFFYAALQSSRQANLVQEPAGEQSAKKSTTHEVPKAQPNPGTVTQQAGPCSSNVAGSGNVSSVDCGNIMPRPRRGQRQDTKAR
jgi:hypothetical protein